eukprot:6084190-Alexandrium_andersonii.AAC.1
MSRHAPLSDDALRVIAELENSKKTRFLMAWGPGGELYLRAAQAHSRGVASVVDMTRALEVYIPAHPEWCPVGLHGTKEEYVPSICCQ